MEANYHTHTVRCRHAEGTDEEYVIAAIEAGLKVLGFSDHTPYPFPREYYSGFRMRMDDFEGYVKSVLSLKERYKSDIDIYLGVEVEYYPDCFDKLLSYLSDYPIEYMIHGQHLLGNEMNEHYNGDPTDDVSLLERYVEQSIEGFKTGKFLYFAHPDLFYFTGERSDYERYMRNLCVAANKYNMPLEINMLGLMTNRQYPNSAFWKIAGEENCTVILGSDAHKPCDVYQEKIINQALKLVERYNLNLINSCTINK